MAQGNGPHQLMILQITYPPADRRACQSDAGGKRRHRRSIRKIQVESEQHFPRRLAEDRLGKQLPPAQSMPPHACRKLDDAISPFERCSASKSRGKNGSGVEPEQLFEELGRSLDLAPGKFEL